MTINSNWLKKDFKQKYFLYCKDCNVEKIAPQKVAEVKDNNYICRIKITEL